MKALIQLLIILPNPDINWIKIEKLTEHMLISAEEFADLYDGIDPANRKADLRRALNTYPDL